MAIVEGWLLYMSHFTESSLLHLIDLSSRSHQVSLSGMAGTPLYMSPEQLDHTRCTEKVDIYALGVIYFEMNNVFDKNEKGKVGIENIIMYSFTWKYC